MGLVPEEHGSYSYCTMNEEGMKMPVERANDHTCRIDPGVMAKTYTIQKGTMSVEERVKNQPMA